MRKIRLSDADAELFEEEMIPPDFEFLARHKDTFCRMWTEQGNLFWKRYLEVFRSYIVRNHQSLLGLGGLSFDIMRLQHTLDYSFNNIEKSFIEGKVNTAKQLLYQIADLGKSRHRFQFLESKSRSKDPFFTKDTRDLFRYFFGQADETLSYIRVRLLTPVYMRFGGSVVRCIMRWKEASDMDLSDDSYFTPPLPIESKPSSSQADPSAMMCSRHLEDCNNKYQQLVKADPSSPISLNFWPGGDPRFEMPGNPLYDPNAISKSTWYRGLEMKKFQEFYAWCTLSDSLIIPEKQCQDCRARKKSGKKSKKKRKKANSATGVASSTMVDNCPPSTEVDNSYLDNRCRHSSVLDHCMHHNVIPMDPTIARVHAEFQAILDKSESVAEAVRMEIQSYAETELQNQIEDLLDDSIAKDVSDRFRRKGLHACLKDVEAVTHCCAKHKAVPTMTDPPVKEKLGYAGDLNDIDVEDHGKVPMATGDAGQASSQISGSVNGAGAALLTVEERAKPLEARIPVFPSSSVVKECKKEVLMPAHNGRDIKAIFQVHKKSEDSEAAPAEVQVTLQELCEMDGNEHSKKNPLDSSKSLELGNDPLPQLTSQYLSRIVEGFPQGALCAETEDWCGVEVDYSALEGYLGKATHFILKISKPPTAPDLNLAKHVMVQLLWYVVRRKKRPSLGWMMSEEDVFTFCQPLSGSLQHMIGMCFTIILCTPTPDATPSLVNGVKDSGSVEENNASKNETSNNKQDQTTTQEINSKDNDITTLKPDDPEHCGYARYSIFNLTKQPDATASAAKEACKLSAGDPGVTSAGQTSAMAASVAAAVLERAASTSTSASVDDGSEGGETAAAGKKKKKKKSKTKAGEKAESQTVAEEKTESKSNGVEKADTSGTKEGKKQDGKAETNVESKPKGVEKQDSKMKGKEKTASGAAGKGGKGTGSKTAASGATQQSVAHTAADRLALANCKTREELAVVLQKMDQAGKTSPLSHAMVQGSTVLHASQAETDAAFRLMMQSMASRTGLTTAGGFAISDNKTGGYRQKSKCSYCGVVEPAIRTYKKCSKCKQDNVAYARYYCGRPCQLEDWKYRHNLEHQHGVFF